MSEAVVVIHGWHQILSTVPALLGFHPTDSLVIVSLQEGESGKLRSGVTARVDLTDYLETRAATVKHLAEVLIRNGSTKAIVVFYGRKADLDVTRLFAENGVELIDVLSTDNEPAELNPKLAAANALHGIAVQRSRRAVSEAVEYQPHVEVLHLEDLLAPMADSRERDRVLALATMHAKKVLPVLIAACQATGDDRGEIAANLLTLTAVAAFRTGDGVTARAALDRARRIDHWHTLAGMLSTLLDTGMPPEDLDLLVTETENLDLDADDDDDLLVRWRVAAGVPV